MKRYLELKDVFCNPRVAKRLPPEVALRFHALPLDEQNGRVTVAMANPEDDEAREAVLTALGNTAFLIRCDSSKIDNLLSEVWPERDENSLRVLVLEDPQNGDEGKDYCQHKAQILEYVWAFTELIHAQISYIQPMGENTAAVGHLNREIERRGCDLFVLGDGEYSFAQRWIFDLSGSRLVGQLRASSLVVRQPRWALKRILLVARFSSNDDLAADWVVRLARPSGAAVTVLTVTPPMPVMYQYGRQMRPGLDVVMASDTTSGIWLRKLAKRLDKWDISGSFHLRQGEADWQIRQEVEEGDYDLIIVGAEPNQRFTRWLFGGVVGPLLRWADRPVLIAKVPETT